MECKFDRLRQACINCEVLIETYWNVNRHAAAASALGFRVLIETYWNVNHLHILIHTTSDVVLIETYWNVNMIVLKFVVFAEAGLNRNILECKFGFLNEKHWSEVVLIETYWNVNYMTALT